MYILKGSPEDFDSLGNDVNILMFEGYDFMINLTESVMEMVETAINQEHTSLMAENTSLLNESAGSVVAKLKEMFLNMLRYIKTTIMNIFGKLSGRNKKLEEVAKKMQEESEVKEKAFDEKMARQKMAAEKNQRVNSEIRPLQNRIRTIRNERNSAIEPVRRLGTLITTQERKVQTLNKKIEDNLRIIESLSVEDERPGQTIGYHHNIKEKVAEHRKQLDASRTELKEIIAEVSELKQHQDRIKAELDKLRDEEKELTDRIYQIIADNM